MSTITIELDNLTAEEQETVKRLAEKKNPYFVPEYRDKYFHIVSRGDIARDVNDGDGYDRFEFSIGNCFKTEEEAKEAITRMQMQTKWKRLSLEAGEADNPWDGKHKHYYAFCWSNDGWVYMEEQEKKKDANIYFPTMASIRKAIYELGEENVKKYILGVEE